MNILLLAVGAVVLAIVLVAIVQYELRLYRRASGRSEWLP